MRSWWILGIAFAGATLGSGACQTAEEEAGQGGAAASTAPATASSIASSGTGGTAACGTAAAPLDKSKLTEIAFDDGTVKSNLRLQSFTIQPGSGVAKKHEFNKENVHEAVRFELTRPARVHGFEVMWAPGTNDTAWTADPKLELAAGLYGDFGYNGFDFWAPEPLWTGTRCAGDVDFTGQWVTYAFDEPIEVKDPGLVYVAHLAKPSEPVWWFDGTVTPECKMDASKCCQKFGDCQSAFNLPNAEKTSYFNGLSFPFQNHFMARLWVEYTDEVKSEERIFQPAANSPSGSHVAWGDYDADGWDDLLLGAALYKNDGKGGFVDVSKAAGLAGLPVAGGVWGDYDNDGCLDIFFFTEAYSTRDYLMRSKCDGTFEDVTLAAGIDNSQTYNYCGDATKMTNTQAPTAAAAWLDFDADGKLDLYLANFNCWNDYTFYIDTVFRNKGDGTFENITGKQGFSLIKTPSRGVAPADADGDGDVDLFINNYVLVANLFYRNDGGGMVSEVGKTNGAAGKGTAYGGTTYYGHTIGAAWGDLDNDGDLDLIAANLAHPRFFHFSDKTNVLLNDGKGVFTDIKGDFKKPASAAGLRYQETHSVPMLADFDQNGTLDLIITAVYDGRPTDFYWGNGDGHFTLDAFHAGITTTNGWGLAGADYDHDGDMDLFATTLFKNEEPTAKKGHWLQVKVTGTKANRAALGATVKVKTGATTRIRHVEGGSGKGCQDSQYLHFGIGAATMVDEIRVMFPGGKENVFKGPFTADQRVWLTEDAPAPKFGWAPN
jgi:hypothetical protein